MTVQILSHTISLLKFYFMNEIHVEERLGRGSENNVYKRADDDTAIKAFHIFGREWQTMDPAHLEEGNDMLAKHGVKTIQTTVHRDVYLCHPDGTREFHHMVIETPLISDIEKRRVKYKDLLDPEIGPELIQEMMQVVRAADAIYNDPESPKGLDPYGGEIITDIVKGLLPALILKISKILPTLLRNKVRDQLAKVEGQMRNFVKTENGPMLIDSGMHDFSEDQGKYTPLTKNMHNLMFASLIEMLIVANEHMPPEKQIPQSKIESLPFNGTDLHRKTAQNLMAVMLPLYEQYDMGSSKNQTRAIG